MGWLSAFFMMWLVLVISQCILVMVLILQVTMKNVCHVPQLSRSLMYVGQLDDNGNKIIFASQSFHIRNKRELSWFSLPTIHSSKEASFGYHKLAYARHLARPRHEMT